VNIANFLNRMEKRVIIATVLIKFELTARSRIKQQVNEAVKKATPETVSSVGGEENFRSIIKCAAQSAHREVLRRHFFDLLEC
jgi:hypothetical protein